MKHFYSYSVAAVFFRRPRAGDSLYEQWLVNLVYRHKFTLSLVFGLNKYSKHCLVTKWLQQFSNKDPSSVS